MSELRVGERRWQVAPGSNLLDALNAADCRIPFSCRAGSCQACLVRCLDGEPEDAMPAALPAERRAQGWRLACQCRVAGDLQVAPFDPQRDGLPARVRSTDWLSPGVLRLRLESERPLRYQAGQHVLLWSDPGPARQAAVARPYSFASLPQEDSWLEFHLDCRRPGLFRDVALGLRPGDTLSLGELGGGSLHYASDWSDRPLLLLAAGTGLAPLWSVLREALRQRHEGPIRVVHLADSGEHYLAQPLRRLAGEVSALTVELPTPETLGPLLEGLRRLPRQTRALLCGGPRAVEAFARSLYLAGVPRSQVATEAYLSCVAHEKGRP